MSVSQLAKVLKVLHIPSFFYDIDIVRKGMADDCICLRKKDDTWIVFNSDRGEKFNIMQYKFESDACIEALRRILLVYRYR